MTDGGVHRTVPALEVHKLQAFLQFDQHGLQPYHGVVNVLEPGDDTGRDFEALGHEWAINSSTYWNGKIEHPEKDLDDGLYEYNYQLVADDDVGDRDATISLRAGYPRARHVETGEPIQSLPDDTPECLRVEAQTTNVDPDDLLELLRCWFEEMSLNPDYISQPNDWSRITAYEGYVRVDRAESNAHLTGDGGLIQELAQFGSSDGDKGRYRWDHEKTQGHYEAVALDRGTWETLLPGQAFEKRLKSYHPDHVRSASEDDDPLYHPKLEVQMWQKQQSPVPWDQREALYDEFLETAANALHWSGIGIDPDSETFIEDPYHDAGPADREVQIIGNPLEELRDAIETDARDQLVSPDVTPGDFATIEAVADGGSNDYRDLADDAGVSISTVYRAARKLPILEADGGTIDFPDVVTRERICTLLDRFEQVADGFRENLRNVVQGFGRLTGDDGEPTALERWMDAHGAVLANHADDLHFEFDGRFTEHEIVEILRSGYNHAVQSGLESLYRDALVTFQTIDGERRQRWSIIHSRNGREQVLGRWPLRA